MKKKFSLTVDDEFILYCQLNKIDDIEKLAKETFNRGFSLLKYPDSPIYPTKEKIVEKIIEKEVFVKGETKIITDTTEIDKLKKENESLQTELNDLKLSLEKFNRGSYMKNSDLGSIYDE